MNKHTKIVKLIDEYSELLNAGSLVVCPISGITFNIPSLTHLSGIYFESRHPIGIKENYPAILYRGLELSKLTKMELAGVIISTFTFYGAITSDLTVFKQNEVLRSNLDKQTMLNFIAFLANDFVPFQGKKANFFIWPDITANNLYSFQHTCFNLKHNIGFNTLTVKEAIEQKVLIIDGKGTLKNMTSDIKALLHKEVAEYVSEESFEKMQKAVVAALTFKNDSMVLRVIKAIHEKLGRETETFAFELQKTRAYLERNKLIKIEQELDLNFTEENNDEKSNPETSGAQCTNSGQNDGEDEKSSSGNNESLLERIARIRRNSGNVK